MKYVVDWETVFCEDDFPDESGFDYVEATSAEEAEEIVRKRHYHSVVLDCREVKYDVSEE